MQKITPCLWFDNKAEEAAKLYTSIFKKSRITSRSFYDEPSAKVSGQKEGSLLTVEFEIDGQRFTALNGGPLFKFNESISFVIDCKGQKEVDYYWKNLVKGGQESQCGWLKDKFGVSWQVVPSDLSRMLTDKNKEKAKRTMEAMLKMKKLDVKTLKKAYDGR